MDDPLVSIIMPAFNAAQFIAAAIDSVLNLSVPFWELIIVDDGSTDSTADICRNYVQTDNRIKYLSQSNAGVSAARNTGISQAQGKWLAFLDADDLLFQNALDEIAIVEDTCEYVIQSYTREQRCSSVNTHEVSTYTSNDIIESILSISSFQKKFPRDTVIDCYNALSVWGRFFRRNIVISNDVAFPVGIRQSEDTLFCLNYCLHISRAVAIDEVIYYYRPNESSVTSQYADYFEDNIIKLFGRLTTYDLPKALSGYMASYVINNVTNCVMLYYLDSRSALPLAVAAERLQKLCETEIVAISIKKCSYKNIAYGKHHILYNAVLLFLLKRKIYKQAIWTLDKMRRIFR